MDTATTDPKPNTLRTIRALYGRWVGLKTTLFVLVCTVAGLVLGYFASMTVPYRWQVDALILTQVGRELGTARSDVVVAGGRGGSVSTPNKSHITTEVELLKSPALLRATWADLRAELGRARQRERQEHEQDTSGGGGGGFSLMGLLNSGITSLIRALDLKYEPEPEELQFASWSATMNVAPVARSNMIRVECISPSPQIAKLSLERWLALYQDAHVDAYSQQETTPLFEQEAERLRGIVEQAEAELTQFRLDTGIFDVDLVRRSLMNQKMAAEDGLRDRDAQIAAELATIKQVDEQLRQVPEHTPMSSSRGTDPTWDYLEKALVDAERDLAAKEIDYEPTSPFITQARELRDHLQAMMKDRSQVRDNSRVTGRNPIHTSLEQKLYGSTTRLASLQAEKSALAQNLAAIEQDLVDVEKTRGRHIVLVEDLREAHRDLEQVLEGARIGRMNNTLDRARVTNVRVVSPPSIPPQPLLTMGLPHRVAITAMGGGMGFFVAVGLYFLLLSLRGAGLLPWGARHGDLFAGTTAPAASKPTGDSEKTDAP